jgi:hypothetical protein
MGAIVGGKFGDGNPKRSWGERKGVVAGLDDVKRNLTDWCAVAADRTAEAAKISARRYDKFAIGREIDKRFAELGSFVYEGLGSGRTDLLDDPRVAELVAAVRALQAEREAKEGEIADIRQEHAGRRRAGAEDEAGADRESRGPDPEFSD